jgi:Fe-S-cluster containining protein
MHDNDELIGILQIEQAFFDDGYHLATSLLSRESTSENHFHAMQELSAVLDAFIDAFLQNANESTSPTACKKGCAWCCSQAVFAQDYEFKFLKTWMFNNLSSAEMERVRKRAKEKLRNTKNLSREDQLQHKEACPLLENNVCMIYKARPVACRIYLSSSLESCKEEFGNPELESFPQLYNIPFRAGRKLNEGYAKGLLELGLNIKELSIEEGLLS